MNIHALFIRYYYYYEPYMEKTRGRIKNNIYKHAINIDMFYTKY